MTTHPPSKKVGRIENAYNEFIDRHPEWGIVIFFVVAPIYCTIVLPFLLLMMSFQAVWRLLDPLAFPASRALDGELKAVKTQSASQRSVAEKARNWLLAQKTDELPTSAIQVITTMLAQLEKLSAQMEGADESHPATAEIKRLLANDLPNMLQAYNNVPEHLRQKAYLGRTADEQLTEGLTTISNELDDFEMLLAQGPLDALAVKTRYLGYKYGEEPATA